MIAVPHYEMQLSVTEPVVEDPAFRQDSSHWARVSPGRWSVDHIQVSEAKIKAGRDSPSDKRTKGLEEQENFMPRHWRQGTNKTTYLRVSLIYK